MGSPRKRHFWTNDVEEAREQILRIILSESRSNKVFYVDGWNAFGATAVLRSIAAVLPSRKTTPELCFERLIFVDCSKCKNRREVQRVIAQELKLDHSVIAILDKQDEEDDFDRIDGSSRDAIDSVARVIYQTLSATKFIMFFLNGSDGEIDVGPFGIPPFSRYGNNMMIWTFNKSYLTMHRELRAVTSGLSYTDVVISSGYQIYYSNSSEFRSLLSKQVDTIVARVPCMLDIDPRMFAECCLYELFLHSNFHVLTRFDWVAHASNYWTCDAIIQGDRARDIGLALHGEISWEGDEDLLDAFIKSFMRYPEPPFLVVKDGDVYEEGSYRWISVTSKNRKLHGMQTIPAETSSFFLAFEGSDDPSTFPNGLFEHSNNLGVLVLCYCAFNFASPPFRKCHKLRFLGLDHCTHSKTAEAENHTEWACLNSLLVLDLRYTVWIEILSGGKIDVMTNIIELNIEGVICWQYVAQLQGRLPKLQRLRVIKPTSRWETSKEVDNSFVDKMSMEILDLSGNRDMENLPTSLSEASGLQVLILDGCDGLENVGVPGRLPATLKSFSFDGYGPAFQRTPTVELPPEHFRPSNVEHDKDISTSKISLEGCTKLDNLFVRGLNNLVELDLSGTAIKILDFNTMVVQVPRLKRLFLIGCKHLRAIVFLRKIGSSKLVPDLELVCIDTRAGIVCPRPSVDKVKSFRLQVHAIIVDARLARSLDKLFNHYFKEDRHVDIYYNIHVTSSPVHDGVVQLEETNHKEFDHCDQGSLRQLIPAGLYSDVVSMVGDPPMLAFPQPPATRLDRHVEIAEGSRYANSELGRAGNMLTSHAESLHLHDVSVHAAVPPPSGESRLRWCRVERCPNLDNVFQWADFGFDISTKLETFWASDLLMARSIWSKGPQPLFNLQHLHLRSCPSLQFVMTPLWASLPSLETLHIIHCGGLGHVFLQSETYLNKITTFPKLTTIHLHDLPKLHQICEATKMVAPALESIKIRGCWSLRRLPSVGARGAGEKRPTIEIEKDVWDALEWDADHRPDHFEAPVHSRYYKKKLPRVSVLR